MFFIDRAKIVLFIVLRDKGLPKKCKKVKSKKNNDRIVTHLVLEDDEMVVISLDEFLEESFDKDKCLLTLSTDSELREWGLLEPV